MVDAKVYPNLQSINYRDAVYADSNGMPGTEYPLGTATHPVLTIAEAQVIATARNLHDIVVRGDHQLIGAAENLNFHGYDRMGGDSIDINGQDVDGSSFENLGIATGAQGGTLAAYYIDCVITNVAGLRGVFVRCLFQGTNGLATGGGADNLDFTKCHAMQGAATITVNTPDLVNFYDFEGELILQTMGGGTINIFSSVGTRVMILATCTAGTINIYGNAVVINQAAGTEVNNYTINRQVDQIIEGHKGLYESWQGVFDDTIWARINPATGVPWDRGVSGSFLLHQCTPNADENARLRGLHYWVHNWLADPVNLLLKRLCIEWEMTLGVHTNVDNAISFWGWMPIAAGLRTTDNIIGFALIGDALQTVTDAGGAETVNDTFGETMANHNKFKIVIEEGQILFFLNEQLIATHNTNVPTIPVLPNFYIDTEASGACAFVFGSLHIWQETIKRY